MTLITQEMWDLAEATETPAQFAMYVTKDLREPWVMARHLEVMNRMIGQAIFDAETAPTPPILLIEMPPRHGKSELISRYLPAWYLGTNPDKRVLFATNTDKLAKRYGRLSRNIMDEWGSKCFGIQLAADSQAQNEWNIAGREGGFFGTSIGGRISGRGANCFPAGTRITTSRGYLPIERFTGDGEDPGVLAFNCAMQRLDIKAVIAVQASFADELIEVTTRDGRSFQCTPEHLIYTRDRGYILAERLVLGDRLLDEFGRTDAVSIVRRLDAPGTPVYDLQVEGCHNFFAEGILAHNCLIIDDLIGKAEDALSEAMRNKVWDSWEADWFRRLEPRGLVVVVSTRWHMDDLIGRLLAQSHTEDGLPVRRLRLPALAEADDPLGRKPGEALWPARYNQTYLERIRSTTTPAFWLSLFQQNPCQHEGTEWPADYFDDQVIWSGGEHSSSDWPSASEFHMTAMAIDPSKGKAGGDYGAIIFGGVARGILWVEASVERMPLEKLVSCAIEMALPRRPQVITVEGNGFQDLAMGLEFNRQYEIRKMAPLPLRMINSTANKEDRIRRLGTYFQQKRVRFRYTAGCRRLVQQLREFPLCEHDDGPDGLEMLTSTFQWMHQEKSENGQGFTARDYTET